MPESQRVTREELYDRGLVTSQRGKSASKAEK